MTALTKKEFVAAMSLIGCTCRYSGKQKTMFVWDMPREGYTKKHLGKLIFNRMMNSHFIVNRYTLNNKLRRSMFKALYAQFEKALFKQNFKVVYC